MIKIVGYDDTKKKRVTCGNCAAILEYVEKDVKIAKYTCMGDPSGHHYVECPNCPDTWAARIPGSSW